MIAATYTQGGEFQVRDVAAPEIRDDEILLRVMASSICGTDVRIIRNGHRKLQPGQRIVLGHEFAGVIERCGKHAAAFPVGMRVGVAPNIGCGQCEFCIQGLTNMCPDYSAFGINIDGAHTEYLAIPSAAIAQGNMVAFPESLSFVEASLIEPLSCVVNGSRASQIRLGDIVVIFGAGPIGLLHLLLANLSGASRVIVVDVLEHRLQVASELGASLVINSKTENAYDRIMHETGKRGADVVITACSIPQVQEQAFDLLAPYGRICLFGGLPKDNSRISIDTNAIHYKNLIVTGVTGGSPYDFRIAMKLVAGKRLDLSRVISHVFPAAEMAQAFDASLHGETMKVVIRHD